MPESLMVVNDLLPCEKPRGLRGRVRYAVYVFRHPRRFLAGWRPATNLVANEGFEMSASGWTR